MAKQYDFVDAATKTVIDWLQDEHAANLRYTLLMSGYHENQHDEHVGTIIDYLEPDLQSPEGVFTMNAMTLCLDMADWRKVCAECGITYHEEPKTEGEATVPVSVLQQLLDDIIACGDAAVQARNNTPQNVIAEMRQQSYHEGRAEAYSSCQAVLANLLKYTPR